MLCLVVCDTSVQFGVAITAHLLSYCAKDRGVLALHFGAGFQEIKISSPFGVGLSP